MSEDKMRASFEECVKETECLLMVDEDTAFDIFRYAYKAALQEREAGAVTDFDGEFFAARIKRLASITGIAIPESREAIIGCSPSILGMICRVVEGLYASAPQYAKAIGTAAIMKCAEVADAQYQRDKPLQEAGGQDNSDGYVTGYVDGCGDCGHAIRALIPQDGRTQLEEFGMKCIDEASALNPRLWTEHNLRAIVTNQIGAAK